MWLLIAFIAIPLVEIALFIQVGGAIGLWSTLLIVVITAILGTYLVRQQGTQVLGQLKNQMSEMRDPTEALVHGAMIVFSGALLLTPGFFTDAVGFALLIPNVRARMFEALKDRLKTHSFDTGPDTQRPKSGQSDVIDGEFEEIDPEPRRTSGPSGWTK
ncbi:MAG: FxsA family protein [Paracoccaceae bacterium]